MGQGELPLLNHCVLNPLTLLTRSSAPPSHGALIQSEHAHNRLQWTAIGKQSHHQNNQLGGFAKSFQHRSRPSGKGLTTDHTTIAFAIAIMNADRALIAQTTCSTRQIGAKLKGRIHGLCWYLHIYRMPCSASFFKSPIPQFTI